MKIHSITSVTVDPPLAKPIKLAVVEGRASLPAGPGLGIAVDADAVHRYAHAA